MLLMCITDDRSSLLFYERGMLGAAPMALRIQTSLLTMSTQTESRPMGEHGGTRASPGHRCDSAKVHKVNMPFQIKYLSHAPSTVAYLQALNQQYSFDMELS